MYTGVLPPWIPWQAPADRTMGANGSGVRTSTQLKQQEDLIANDDRRLDMEQWKEDCAARAFILRGGHLIPTPLTEDQLSTAVCDTADPTSAMLSMLMTLKGVRLSAFVPPLPPGVSPFARSFDIHFKTFVEALVIFVEFGTGRSCPISAARRAILLAELHAMVRKVQDYFTLNDAYISMDPDAVRTWALEGAEADVKEFFKHLSQDAIDLRHAHRSSPPENRSGPNLRRPAFSRLGRLVTDADPFSLVGRMDTGLSPLRTGAAISKRKAAHELGQITPQGGPRPRRSAADAVTPASVSPWVQTMMSWGTPRGACHHYWQTGTCPRAPGECKFAHNQQHPSAPRILVQQAGQRPPQVAAHPLRPLGPPPPPSPAAEDTLSQ